MTERNKNWTEPEIMTAVYARLGTNEKMSTDKCGYDAIGVIDPDFSQNQ